MKRWGFGGQPASHGNSLKHRAMGSSGGSQGSGSRVLPGKRMPGRMGGERVTVQNLKVLKIDAENGIVVVNGMCSCFFLKGDFLWMLTETYCRRCRWPQGLRRPDSGRYQEAVAECSSDHLNKGC